MLHPPSCSLPAFAVDGSYISIVGPLFIIFLSEFYVRMPAMIGYVRLRLMNGIWHCPTECSTLVPFPKTIVVDCYVFTAPCQVAFRRGVSVSAILSSNSILLACLEARPEACMP